MTDTTGAREPSIHDYPWLQGVTGVDPADLGAVMLPVRFREGLLERGLELGILAESDLHVSEKPERFWVKGDVTGKAHVTLLYGLLTPAYEQAEVVMRLMSGWRAPAWLPILSFEAFPSPYPDEKYACIVARVADRDGLLAEARGRLEYLPHVNTFPVWKMHATVAYVEPEAAEAWLSYLNTRSGQVVEVPATNGMRPALDLGEEK